MESEGTLPYSQQPTTGPYPEPDESITHLPTVSLKPIGKGKVVPMFNKIPRHDEVSVA